MYLCLADVQAGACRRASCEVVDLSSFFNRPTRPQLAAFILPSVGRVPSAALPHTQTCESVRQNTKHAQTTHHGLRSDDLGTNRLSPQGLDVVGDAPT